MSNNVNINGATDRTSIKYHKIYKDNQESLNKRLLPESYLDRYLHYITRSQWSAAGAKHYAEIR